MAYATPDQLAVALDIRVTPANTDVLDACLEAAAAEIDHTLDRLETDPLPVPAPELVVRTNVNRAVEWYKAPAAYNGGVGYEQTGMLPSPTSGFERHAAVLVSLKQQWGIG
jgi:acetylornithine deacetylase/succinyl-diaminopimelate desuccinylase-like protein